VTSAAAMSRRFWLLTLLLFSACSGGGGGGSSIEVLDWPAFRRDPFNSGLGGSNIDKNDGEIRFEAALEAPLRATNLPVPAIGKKGKIYIGTSNGLVGLDKDGTELSSFRFCDLANDPDVCNAPTPTCIEVGNVDSTPTVTAEGDLIVSATSGYVFAVRDEDPTKKEESQFNCQWALPPASPSSSPVLSSPQVVLDSIDQAITSVFIGTNSGWLQALNGNNGSEKWRFPPDSSPFGPLTSTVALSPSRTVHFTAPDGVLYSLDTAGRFLWSAPIGVDSPRMFGRLPSPAVNVSIFAVGGAGSVFAYNPDGTRRWQFRTRNRVFGSPAFLNQFVIELIDDKEETRLETVVRVVDENGIMYGILDRNGREFDARLCSETTDVACTTNLDCTGDETCDQIRECTGTDDRCISDEGCGTDQTCDSTGMTLCSGTDRNRSCFDDSDCAAKETCILIRRCSVSRERCIVNEDCPGEETCESSVRMTTESALPVTSSPVLSTDLFGVVGSDDGRLCARRLDEIVPEDDIWETGCITIAPGKALSSPVIDLNGVIYVTSDEMVYAIGSN